MRMTWRERLADWISGGALTRAEADRAAHLQTLYRTNKSFDDAMAAAQKTWHVRNAALRDIAAMETQNANSTVKRMARRAREALE